MRRKFVAAALVLAMIMGMSAIAMAEEPTTPEDTKNKGTAGIAYKEGKIVIVDPDDPKDPNQPDIPTGEGWEFVTNRNIDFGLHDLSQNIVEQKYASWMEQRGPGRDYVGIVIKNGSTDKLTVTVEIGKFSVGTGDAAVTTLEGYILDLVRDNFKTSDTEDIENGIKANITNPYEKGLLDPEKATANSTNSAFNKETDHKDAELFAGGKANILNTPGIGVHAASWGGVLTVPKNSVTIVGDAQATMTWNFERVVPPVTPDP
jgi:hypothetical protein